MAGVGGCSAALRPRRGSRWRGCAPAGSPVQDYSCGSCRKRQRLHPHVATFALLLCTAWRASPHTTGLGSRCDGSDSLYCSALPGPQDIFLKVKSTNKWTHSLAYPLLASSDFAHLAFKCSVLCLLKWFNLQSQFFDSFKKKKKPFVTFAQSCLLGRQRLLVCLRARAWIFNFFT